MRPFSHRQEIHEANKLIAGLQGSGEHTRMVIETVSRQHARCGRQLSGAGDQLGDVPLLKPALQQCAPEVAAAEAKDGEGAEAGAAKAGQPTRPPSTEQPATCCYPFLSSRVAKPPPPPPTSAVQNFAPLRFGGR